MYLAKATRWALEEMVGTTKVMIIALSRCQ